MYLCYHLLGSISGLSSKAVSMRVPSMFQCKINETQYETFYTLLLLPNLAAQFGLEYQVFDFYDQIKNWPHYAQFLAILGMAIARAVPKGVAGFCTGRFVIIRRRHEFRRILQKFNRQSARVLGQGSCVGRLA
jgi:hypothetical protein